MCGRHAKGDKDDKATLDYLLAVRTNLFLCFINSGDKLGKDVLAGTLLGFDDEWLNKS